jgi:hypothetical protein
MWETAGAVGGGGGGGGGGPPPPPPPLPRPGRIIARCHRPQRRQRWVVGGAARRTRDFVIS